MPLSTTLRYDGDVVEYTPSSAVTAGTVVVQGTLVGVALQDIAANALGALSVEGVFDFPKTAAGSGQAIAVGVAVYWDDTNDVATTTSSGNTLIGKVVLAALTTDTTVRVRISQ